jgi:hypothetical protein
MGREGETDGGGKGNRVRGGSQSGAVGFDQGTSKDQDSPPWTKSQHSKYGDFPTIVFACPKYHNTLCICLLIIKKILFVQVKNKPGIKTRQMHLFLAHRSTWL